MLTELLTTFTRFLICLAIFFSVSSAGVKGQDTLTSHTDTVNKADTSRPIPDTSKVKKTAKKSSLGSKVEYQAKDSMRFEIKNQNVVLFNEAQIKYQDLELKAGYLHINFPTKMVDAAFSKDSAGKEIQVPEFKQGSQNFKSRIMSYDYETKRGYIQNVFTKQDEGYLHGIVVKKMENDVTYLKDGWYTTCDRQEDPHFEFKFGKAKVIPGKKVITGPAYLVIADVPTPIGVPFGWFPSKSGRRSGVIIPTYGESANRGFFLENGGYYWAMNKYTDLFLVGDIYSHGSWAVKPRVNYRYRYHYSGTFNLSYALNKIGEQDTPGFQKSTDFNLIWRHAQDPKARPHSNFSANVNIVSQNFNKYNPVVNAETYLSNTFQSSVNFTTNWNNNYYLTINGSHSQNTLTKTINITLPQLAFSVNQFYPFRKKEHVGKMRWYENITTRYSLDAVNQYNTTDTTIFRKKKWYYDMQNGMRHTVPVSGTFHVLKYFNWTTSITLNDRMYLSTIRKHYVLLKGRNAELGLPARDSLVVDTVRQFANAFDGNLTTSVNTHLYGMYQFRHGPLIAIRHMVTPSVSISYAPDFSGSTWGYNKYIENDNSKNPQKYSIFEGSVYGGPSTGKIGLLSFSLSNNLEMKVRNRKDTVTGTRKIVLIEDLIFAESYDLTKDSLQWSVFTISGHTTLFKNLRITYGSSWDPYAHDSLGNRLSKTVWELHHRLLQIQQTQWNLGLTYTLSSDKSKKKKTTTKGTEQERKDIEEFRDYYVDFDIPWSFNLNYTFNFVKNWNPTYTSRVSNIVQTLGLNGQLNLTPKWKISVMTGWDFTNGQLAYTSLDLYRDLHCWEMRFGWIPKGAQQSWSFSINVKASVLQDLKLNKKKDFRDYAP